MGHSGRTEAGAYRPIRRAARWHVRDEAIGLRGGNDIWFFTTVVIGYR